MERENFYCQKICGDQEFSIIEWNEMSFALDKSNISEKDKQKILFPSRCNSQCFDCIAIVGERQTKTNKLK
jgi:hypothetical protein